MSLSAIVLACSLKLALLPLSLTQLVACSAVSISNPVVQSTVPELKVVAEHSRDPGGTEGSR